MILSGNIVANNECAFGKIELENSIIKSIELSGECRKDAQWILPGFIDVHLHGIYRGDATPELVNFMAEDAPKSGLTTLCPAMASDSPERMLQFVDTVRDLVKNPAENSSKIAGSHLEGPFLDMAHKGGMNENFVRNVDINEVHAWLKHADGTLKIVTIAPELENALTATKLLNDAKVRVSAGHTGMNPAQVKDFVNNGGSAVCHLFDTFDGRENLNGVSQVCLADEVLIEDKLFIELITDGIHVPPTLIKLAVRAAGVDRIIGITDSMCGTGLPDGSYPMTDAGREFVMKAGDVARLKDDPNIIVGSCLTQQIAFYNLTERFGFSEVEAMKFIASNPARYLGIEEVTGTIKAGLQGDIALLSADKSRVEATFINGKEVYHV